MTVTLKFDDISTDAHTRRTLSEISLSVAKGKKIVVVTGAGISCSSGIPDFRSSDGLYALVKERYPDVVLKGRDLFDASLFRDPTSTAVFYTFIARLKRSIDAATPTPTHRFIKALDTKKKLLRSYTQNIDGLEAQVGLLGTACQEARSNGKGKSRFRAKDVRNVQLHGDIHRVRCTTCSAEYACSEEHLSFFEKGIAPDCPECLSRSEARIARSARAIRVGSLRPAIVLYDETHPLGDDIGYIHSADLTRKPDLLIIMGTSLKVHGLRKLVKDFAKTVHSSSSSRKSCKVIFVNKTAPSSEWSDIIDYHICGETDAWTTKVINDWKKMKPADWEVQQTLLAGDGDNSMNSGLKVVKSIPVPVKDRQTGEDAENVAPPFLLNPEHDASVNNCLSIPPPSPSKRRRKSSHYDDIESSPSKRQTVSDQQHVMPNAERKLLFAETTNHPVSSGPEADVFKSDAGICDMSMRDVTQCSRKLTETQLSKMDISICDLSMRDVETIAPQSLPKGQPKKARPKAQGSRTNAKQPIQKKPFVDLIR
ncbi:DHS-like NAD/FAD-binding domain-containing protein [Phlegmacium glaucopus]|nr:DHS-like NAD/FAD-binding domain-containing protein [Phlegmacium glaucopus]